jgi:hypothetical protein
MIGRPGTTHDDLMDLGTRWSYADLEQHVKVPVNGKHFVVVHVEIDEVTGLDAYTFRNHTTGELSIGFQGTDGALDVLADATLITSLTPAQFAAADRYVDTIERDLGPVGSVCGNSLGGGLAAHVATTRPYLQAVTVNPAPVPWGAARPGVRNVRNYITETDPLHRALQAGRLDHRLVGETVTVAGTSFHLDHLVTNHVGSDRGEPAIQPYDASMAVPFSLFHADRVLGGGSFGGRVAIDVGNLDLMTAGLRHQRSELLAVLAVELTGVEEQLRVYATELPQRAARMGQTVADVVDEAYLPVRTAARAADSQVTDVLRRTLVSLPSPPGPVAFVWRPLLAEAFSATASAQRAVQDLLAFTAREAARRAWQVVWGVMLPESRDLTHALIKGGGRLRRDAGLVDRKWSAFAKSADAVARAVAQADESSAAAIAARRAPHTSVSVRAAPWPDGTVAPLPDDRVRRFHQTVVDTRQTVAGEAVLSLAGHLARTVTPLSDLCGIAINALNAADALLAAGARQVRVAAEVLSASAPGQVVTLVTDDALRKFASSVEATSSTFTTNAADVRAELLRIRLTLDRLPDLVNHLRPHLTETFFSDAMIESTYDSFLKSRNLVRRSEVAFDEVRFQLEDHEAQMIAALARRAEDLRSDLATTDGSLTSMVS